ncbi:MAG: hypothetical protein U0520_03635 [Candidatus Saccharimonadales bacterium]
MSNFNTCEHDHQDVGGFLDAVAEEGAALQIAAALGSAEPVRLQRRPTIIDFALGSIPSPLSPETPEGNLHQTAKTCARAIIAGECTQYALEPTESLVQFTIHRRHETKGGC